MKKKLAKYLAEYVEQEIDAFEQGFGNDDIEIDSSLLTDWLIYGIEAFESIEDVEILVVPQIHEISCETCRKCGETICGNDTESLMCWERG